MMYTEVSPRSIYARLASGGAGIETKPAGAGELPTAVSAHLRPKYRTAIEQASCGGRSAKVGQGGFILVLIAAGDNCKVIGAIEGENRLRVGFEANLKGQEAPKQDRNKPVAFIFQAR
jgi:hypothetical protein